MKALFRSGRPTAANIEPDSELPIPVPKRFSQRSLMITFLIVGTLLIVLPSFVVYLRAVLGIQAAAQAQSDIAVQMLANNYEQWVQRQAHTAETVARDPQLSDLLSNGNAKKRAAREQALIGLFPDAIRARLLEPGMEEVDLKASPPISYAALDLLRHVESGDTRPPVEVEMAGTPQQHINLVRPIPHPSGKGIAGHLMVSFALSPLQALLAQGVQDGYVELQQIAGANELLLGSYGASALKQDAPRSKAKISGTRWQVFYWAPPQLSASATHLLLLTVVSTGAAVLLLVFVVVYLFRRLTAALHADQATLLNIVKDMRDRRVKSHYPSALAELYDTIELMKRTAGATVAGAQKTAVKKQPIAKEPAGDENVAEEKQSDPLFDDNVLDITKVAVAERKVDPSIFRAYDIRGIVGKSLTEEVAYEIGRAIGSEAYSRGEQSIVVGRDGRLSGQDMVRALIRGLQESGRDVKDIGQVPTPVLYFAAQFLNTPSAVMVTGSHNPPDYNGFKIVLGGETLACDAIQGLLERIESGDLLSGGGGVERIDVLSDYVQAVQSDVQVVRPFKLVVDCGNGVAGVVAPSLFRALGCQVEELFCEVDGRFPNHHPDPGQPENLTALIQAVQDQGADLGIAFDGDGDRLGVVSPQGEIIWPDRLMMLFAIDVLSRNPGAQIIYDVKCSRNLATLVAEHGGEALMSVTGHSLMKAKMNETGALLAGEMSGHIFFKERWFGFDDGLYSAARLLEILANEPRSPGEVFANLPNSLATPELHLAMSEGEPSRFMEKLLGAAHFENARVITLDGLRVEYDDGWGLVRASNTTPSLVMRFEAEDELALSRIQDEFRRLLLQLDASLSLPF